MTIAMKISEAIATLERIKAKNGDQELWMFGAAGFEEVERIAEIIEPEHGDGKFTACIVAGDAIETVIESVERGFRAPSRSKPFP